MHDLYVTIKMTVTELKICDKLLVLLHCDLMDTAHVHPEGNYEL